MSDLGKVSSVKSVCRCLSSVGFCIESGEFRTAPGVSAQGLRAVLANAAGNARPLFQWTEEVVCNLAVSLPHFSSVHYNPRRKCGVNYAELVHFRTISAISLLPRSRRPSFSVGFFARLVSHWHENLFEPHFLEAPGPCRRQNQSTLPRAEDGAA